MNFLKENFVYTLQIKKIEVDTFKKGKRIPSCQLVARCEMERPTTLKHLVTLSGAKDPHNTFTIYRSYDSGNICKVCTQGRSLYIRRRAGGPRLCTFDAE